MDADNTTVNTKPISIKISDSEAISMLESLRPSDKSNPEFIKELLECYKIFKGKNCSKTLINHFPNLQGKDKQEKEPYLKEIFGLEANDPLLMSECDLLEKASEYSGKSIEEMAVEGRILVAKNEIGRQVQYAMGKGKKGSADEKINQTLDFMKQTGQKLSLNRLTQLSGSNRKTVEAWCQRNNVTFE